MNRKHHPHIKSDISKIEILLARANVGLVLLEIFCFVINWNSLPRIISLANKRGGFDYYPKFNFFMLCLVLSLPPLLMQISAAFARESTEIGNKKLMDSYRLLNTRRRDRIKDLWFFWNITLMQLLCSIGAITQIESELGHISIDLQKNISFIPFSFVIINFVIHCSLWTRISDK